MPTGRPGKYVTGMGDGVIPHGTGGAPDTFVIRLNRRN